MRIRFDFSRGSYNMHGTEKKGQPWNQQTIRGPKLKHVYASVKPPSVCHRFIFYFKSGACWYFDITLDRRPKAELPTS